MDDRLRWLYAALTLLKPVLAEAGLVLPYTVILIGAPEYTPKTSRAETWVDDGRAHIRLSPRLIATDEVLRVLTHEAIHVCLGVEHMHGKHFARAAHEVGFLKPWTQTHASVRLQDRLKGIADTLGPYPKSS